MIPAFNSAGIIPPYLVDPGRGDRSPYRSNIVELIQHFGYSPHRRAILAGLVRYRQALAAAGFADGYQLIDGSFVEDCETIRHRAPDDIDVLSYLDMPAHYAADPNAYVTKGVPFLNNMMGLRSKATFNVDGYVAVSPPGMRLDEFFHVFAHFTLLFSHQKQTEVWKGTVSVRLDPAGDADALDLLAQMEQEGV